MKKILLILGILGILVLAGCQKESNKGNSCNSLPEVLTIKANQPTQFEIKFSEDGAETEFELFTTNKTMSPPCSTGCKAIIKYQDKHIEQELECSQYQTIRLN